MPEFYRLWNGRVKRESGWSTAFRRRDTPAA